MAENIGGNKRPVKRCWERLRSGGKRLRRCEPTYRELLDQLIVKDYVSSRDECFGPKQHQDSAYFGLPEEIKLMIFDLLPYSDIITMTRTCKSVAEFVNRNYVPSLILPLSPQNLEKLDGRDVLCLKSDFNIMALERRKKGVYLNNLSKIKLSNIQRLVFTLYEKSGINDVYQCKHILPPLYKEILNHYLSFAKQLTYLHISIDRSEETFDIIDVIVEGLPCLSKIVLQATNTPNNVIHPIEGEVSQETKARAAELQVPGLYPELTLNALLKTLLEKPSLRSLEILDLSLTQNWDSTYIKFGERIYQLVIMSKSLTHLKIAQDAFFCIDWIECPELVELKFIDLGGDNFERLECLIHHDPFNGYHKKVLISDCPKLERLNDIDIKSLRNRLTSQPSDILELDGLLRSVCNCDCEIENEVEEEEYSDEY